MTAFFASSAPAKTSVLSPLRKRPKAPTTVPMEICIYVVGILLSYTLLLAPWWRNQQEQNRREFEEVYHAFKLRMVRRHYKDYRHLSFAELEEEFDIDASFHNIGHLPH